LSYNEVNDLAVTVATKLNAAARGGKSFNTCTIWENSVRVLTIKYISDTKHNTELLGARYATEDCNRRGNAARDKDRNNSHTNKKLRAEVTRDVHKAKNTARTDTEKVGNVFGQGYLKCLIYKGPKQPCGAFHYKGMACAQFLSIGKCHNLHTLVNDKTKDTQLFWYNHIATQANFEFNPETVTCF
jgi:hypothetical protein